MRAIAVLPVVFFHIDIKGFSGGYLGVDIFFVISGYLITSIIDKEIVNGNFSIVNFYERRIRRIIPALVFVSGITTVACGLVFDPNAFANFGVSLVASTFFSSNIYFWTEAGYFSAPSLEKPLLHTWSLSIEEQFYIFFPILLIAINAFFKIWKSLILISLCVVSFLLCIYGDYNHPDATFYLLPTRAWELLCGALLAIKLFPQLKSYKLCNFISLLGMLLIMVGVFLLGTFKSTYVYYGIFPVLGSMLIILSSIHVKTHVGRLLSAPILVRIGLISYSLYLWHWPIDVLAKYLWLRPISDLEKGFLVLISFVLAYLTWKYIEQPFREKGRLLVSRKALFGVTVFSFLVTSSVGALIYYQDGIAWRNENGRDILEQAEWNWHIHGKNPLYGELELLPGFTEPAKCGISYLDPEFAIWGDSHAMSWLPGLDKSAKLQGKAVAVFTHSSYPPILGYEQFRSDFNTNDLTKDVLNYLSDNPSIKTVILAAAWFDYFHLYKLTGDMDGGATFNMAKDGLYNVVEELEKLGCEIIILEDIPWLEDTSYTVRSFYLHSLFPDLYEIEQLVPTPTRNDYHLANSKIHAVFQELNKEWFVEVMPVESFFYGSGDSFLISIDGIPTYRDSSHLSTFGSQYLSFIFDKIFQK